MIYWADIEAECGSYRDGFVAVFRKYEGQPTDELTAQGHPVTVTMSSFARHMNIPESTFQGWINLAETGAARASQRDRVAEGVRRLSPERQLELIIEILSADRDLARAVFENEDLHQLIAHATREPRSASEMLETDELAFRLITRFNSFLTEQRDAKTWNQIMLTIENRQYISDDRRAQMAKSLTELAKRAERCAEMLLGRQPIAALEVNS